MKAYLRYELGSTFGVVTSSPAIAYDRTGKLVITAALENIAVWNVRQGTLVRSACSDVSLCLSIASACVC